MGRYIQDIGHICSCFYYTQRNNTPQRIFLPSLHTKVQTSIIESLARTTLVQKFRNTSTEAIPEVKYSFPLFDGVSVVGFLCRVDDRVINGIVKEKETARADYKDAVSRGETAGLFEQDDSAADIFITTIGNVPAGADMEIELIYLGELKHDAEVDGIRYIVPTSIAPRYGSRTHGELAPNASSAFSGSSIEFTLDVTVAEGSVIRTIRSPSHPIDVSMGTTSINSNADPKQNIASVSLGLDTAELEKDFVLQIVAKDTGVPKAFLETHPTIPGQRALMATLVPKFKLPSIKPEVVFVCDRSGSMYDKMETVRKSMQVFLKSLPVGVSFNICSFGSRYSFLFEKSKLYDMATLETALTHVKGFQDDYGGTEIQGAIEATINQRHTDIPLEICLLTDGEIWNQQILFDYLHDQISNKKQPIRVFTLGIGNDVSHSLIEGVARAGRGFSQSVLSNEKLDSKVVRMLKGALTPHIDDYTLEVKYEKSGAASVDEDFEIIEKVDATMSVPTKYAAVENPLAADRPPKSISLYDESADVDSNEASQDSAELLPQVSPPKLLQAPWIMPPLFPFTRTTVYILMSPSTTQQTPTSVLLRAISKHGPLELEIPIHALEAPDTAIHQLATKKAIQELEEGKGWLCHATETSRPSESFGPKTTTLLLNAYPSKFEALKKAEAVRLGTTFQVPSTHCSFVAIETSPDGEDQASPVRHSSASTQETPHRATALYSRGGSRYSRGGTRKIAPRSPSTALPPPPPYGGPPSGSHMSATYIPDSTSFGGPPLAPSPGSYGSAAPAARAALGGRSGGRGGIFSKAQRFLGMSNAPPAPAPAPASYGSAASAVSGAISPLAAYKSAAPAAPGGWGGAPPPAPAPAPAAQEDIAPAPPPTMAGGWGGGGGGLFARKAKGLGMGSAKRHRKVLASQAAPEMRAETEDEDGESQTFLFDDGTAGAASSDKTAEEDTEDAKPVADPFHRLVALQSFDGSWTLTAELVSVLDIDFSALEKRVQEEGWNASELGTVLVLRFLRFRMPEREEEWELMAEKAEGWLEDHGVASKEAIEKEAEILIIA